MFNKDIDLRLSIWFKFRKQLEESTDPLGDVWEFWRNAPFIPYNNLIDPYNQYSWPTPWEIIVKNKYDDFTKALMIGWTIKLTDKFKKTPVELRTIVDNARSTSYNIVIVDNKWVLNFDDTGPIEMNQLPNLFLVENLIELSHPR